jgi:hypothetical protein
MEYLSTFALLGGLYLLAVVSPGPNFFVITQLSLDGNRSAARRRIGEPDAFSRDVAIEFIPMRKELLR